MNRLWFEVRCVEGKIFVKVYIFCDQWEPVPVLAKLLDVMMDAGKSGLRSMALKFPEDSKVIEALDNFLGQHSVTGVSGIHWNKGIGHSVHINCG